LALYDALTTKQASGLLTSFFLIAIDFTHEIVYLLPICGSLGNLTPLNVASHRSDPKKAHPCLITSVWAIVRQNPSTGHFSRRVWGKN